MGIILAVPVAATFPACLSVDASFPVATGSTFLATGFAEPAPRDSTAAIALATAVLARRNGGDIVVGSFAADHVRMSVRPWPSRS